MICRAMFLNVKAGGGPVRPWNVQTLAARRRIAGGWCHGLRRRNSRRCNPQQVGGNCAGHILWLWCWMLRVGKLGNLIAYLGNLLLSGSHLHGDQRDCDAQNNAAAAKPCVRCNPHPMQFRVQVILPDQSTTCRVNGWQARKFWFGHIFQAESRGHL